MGLQPWQITNMNPIGGITEGFRLALTTAAGRKTSHDNGYNKEATLVPTRARPRRNSRSIAY